MRSRVSVHALKETDFRTASLCLSDCNNMDSWDARHGCNNAKRHGKLRWVMEPTQATQRVEEDGRATAMGDGPRTQRVGGDPSHTKE